MGSVGKKVKKFFSPGKQYFAPVAEGRDFSGEYFNINKGLDPQIKDINKDKWGRNWGNSQVANLNKAAAQGRYNTLLTQSKNLMSGAGPAAAPESTTTATAPTAQGMNFSVPPPTKKKTVLTNADQQSLFTR